MNKQQYYIECTFDENGKDWHCWSEQKYLSFADIKSVVWKLCQQELEYNQHESAQTPIVPKIQGFRVVQETITTQIIFESLLT